jgi:hypothetical protein
MRLDPKRSLSMSEFSSRSDPGVAPMSSREERRFFRLEMWLWGKQFAGRLKANALRMKKFLHGNG